jgi:hypothetical protein
VSKWYEKLVQQTYQELLEQETDVTNIIVEHNVKLTGKSGASHQIDVYWEFRIAGNIYRTCIECRNYTSRIKKSRVVEFQGILEDIGSTNGIIATRVGFQEGALTYGSHHGIRLLLINPVLREIQLNMHTIVPRIENFRFNFNDDNVRSILEAAGLESTEISLACTASETYLCDKSGVKTRSFLEVVSTPLGKTGSILIELSDEYLITEYGLIKLDSVSFERFEESSMENIIIGGGSSIARTVIEDVLENLSQYVFDDGSVGDRSRRKEF